MMNSLYEMIPCDNVKIGILASLRSTRSSRTVRVDFSIARKKQRAKFKGTRVCGFDHTVTRAAIN